MARYMKDQLDRFELIELKKVVAPAARNLG
jgi:hypothetical protein